MKSRAQRPWPRCLVPLLLATLAACTPFAGSDRATGRTGEESLGAEEHLRRADEALGRRDLRATALELTLAAEQGDSVAVAERATQFTFTAGYDELAERSVRRWLELVPDSPLPREVLGRLLLRRYALDEAVAEFGRALGSAEPRRDELYLALAADLAAEENARLVTRALARLAAQDPYAPGLQLALGNAALRSGDYELALGAAEAAALDDPQWLEPALLRIRALAGQGHLDAALAALDELPGDEAGGQGPNVLLERARLLAGAGRTAEARDVVAELAARLGDQPVVLRLSALLAQADGDFAAAERELEVLAGVGDPFEAYYYLAQLELRREDEAAALGHYRRISSGSYLLPARIAMAELYRRQGELETALELTADFGREQPAQAFDILGYRAQLLQSAGRREEALAVYDEALGYKPASIAILLARGALADEMGRLQESLDNLALALRIAPDEAITLNAYGYSLANRTTRIREADRLIRRAYEQEPESAAILDSMGWVRFRQGRLEEARSYLEEAWARLPDPEVAAHLAEVWWRMGDRDRARELLEQTLAEHPDSVPATDTARRLLGR